MGRSAPPGISLRSHPCVSVSVTRCVLLHPKGSQPHGPHPSHRGALLPSSHSSGSTLLFKSLVVLNRSG